MVASLQNKKEALEAKIRDKTCELRKVCIEEAELIGFLPPETPLAPGESPPEFRRRVGTTYTLPESLINRLKSKEDEQLAALEVECRIQKGIADAALGIANDVNINKAVRRRHRVLYEECQRRLSELETRLNSMRLSHPKQKKKPRPKAEEENDCVDGGEGIHGSDHVKLQKSPPIHLPENLPYPPMMKNSLSFSGFPKSEPNLHPYSQRMNDNNMVLRIPNMMMQNMDYRHSVMVPDPHHHFVRSSNPSPNGMVEGVWNKNRDLPLGPSMRQSPYLLISTHDYYNDPPMYTDRFGSLDRNLQPSHEIDNRISSTLPRNVCMQQSQSTSSILLPSQTYPENSLMRTESLGSVDNSKLHPERKAKEKEWYETSLDSSPQKTSPKVDSPVPHNHIDDNNSFLFENNNTKMNQASINSIQFDTVVPYESPKNHTVVQAGKWQPYREVTKPFEMSDFYKYSTKFRKGQAQNQNNETSPQLQQKAIYKPLQRMECQPLSQNNSVDSTSLKMSPGNSSQAEGRYPNELINWYHEKSSSPKPHSSTLV